MENYEKKRETLASRKKITETFNTFRSSLRNIE